MRGVLWQADAWDEYMELQLSGKTLLRKVNKLIKDIQRNGYQCSYGKPELLKGDLTGYASIRIDKKNRLVFHVSEAELTIIECGGHYQDN
jgi:toxin YoeB